jgi:GT2 family glycosyltransferase
MIDCSQISASSSYLARRATIVVLTYNRVKEVTRTLEQLLKLPGSPRIIVVDNGSTDGTCISLRRAFSCISVISLPHNIGAAGRNVGIIKADSPYVALCDDDTWWAPNALDRAVKYLEQYPTLAIVCGRVLVGAKERDDPTCLLMSKSPLTDAGHLPGKPILGFLAGASMIRRSPFLEVGGFEPHFFLGGEEMLVAVDLAARGWDLAYVEDVLIHHYPSSLRNTVDRERLLFRNNLWSCWMRLSLRGVYRETFRSLLLTLRRPHLIASLIDAIRGVPWVLRNRATLPYDVEAKMRLLE